MFNLVTISSLGIPLGKEGLQISKGDWQSAYKLYYRAVEFTNIFNIELMGRPNHIL